MKRPVKSGVRSSRGPRINRTPSRAIAMSVPWLSVAFASLVSVVLIIASTPLVPPLGFLMFIAWRQLRPGLMPVWAGLPLGLIDDIFSGQPVGSAVLLWSLAAIALDVVEARLPWRNFLTEWLLAAGMAATYIVLALVLANIAGAATPVWVIMPQVAISILLYPLVGRLVALLDRARLVPFLEAR